MQFDQKKTDDLKLNPKYQNLLKWGLDNGVIIKDVDLPAAFGELTGVVATQDIPANTAIICVPQTLIISQEKCKLSSLSIVYDKHPELFNENQTSDAEFNILIFYLFNEKKKGEQSFFYPYIQAIQTNNTLIDWTKEELSYIEDPIVLDEFAIVNEDIKTLWNYAQDIFNEFNQIFGEVKPTDKQDFYWAAQSVMSRSFGWSLKSTSMIPIADFLNHSNKACTHYFVHSKVEKLEQERFQAKKNRRNNQDSNSDLEDLENMEDSFIRLVQEYYKIKGNKINLSALKIQQDESQIKQFEDSKKTFILHHQEYLTENQLKNLDNLENLSNEDKRSMINWINYEKMKQKPEVNLWDLGFVTSSDSEDNDSDEDIELARNKQLESVKQKELQYNNDCQNNCNTFIFNLILLLQLNGKLKQKKINKSRGQINKKLKQSNKLLNKIKSQIINKTKEIIQIVKIFQQSVQIMVLLLSIILEKKNQVTIQGMAMQQIQTQQIQTLKQNQQQIIEQDEQQDKESEREDSEESNWEWLEENDQDAYFCITTTEPIKQHEQVTVSYGRRTNRFLLSWYGFTLPENKYSSFNFRLWLNTQISKEKMQSQQQIFDTITINKLISSKEWDTGIIKFNGYEIPVSSITKEFRIKKNKLNMDLIMYLRLYLMLYKVQEKDVYITIPVSVDYEVFVMQFCIQLLNWPKTLKNQIHKYNALIEICYQNDQNKRKSKILPLLPVSFSRRFALHINKERKEILINQVMILLEAIIILKKYQESNDLKQSYISEIHNNVHYKMEILRGLKGYLKSIHEFL